MKTKRQVLKDSNLSPALINAVIKGLNSTDQLEDICRHGMTGGYGNFCYYSDTVAFAEKHRKDIVLMLKNLADDLGESVIDMIAGFNCLRLYDDREDGRKLRDAIGLYLYSNQKAFKSDNDFTVQVFNAMAWFAAEEVARAFCE